MNTSTVARQLEIGLEGAVAAGKEALQQVLTATDMGDLNTLDDPGRVAPAEKKIPTGPRRLALTAAPSSLNVIAIPYRRQAD